MIINYDHKTFIVQATGLTIPRLKKLVGNKRSSLFAVSVTDRDKKVFENEDHVGEKDENLTSGDAGTGTGVGVVVGDGVFKIAGCLKQVLASCRGIELS